MAEPSRTGAADSDKVESGKVESDTEASGQTASGESASDTEASGQTASGESASEKTGSSKTGSAKTGSAKTGSAKTGSARAGKTAGSKRTASRTEPTRTQALGERLTAASDEHRANANPDSKAASTKAAKSSGRRSPRRAQLRLTRMDPWSVMKTAFLLSIAMGVVTVVSVVIVWSVLGAAGVWESINATVADVVGTEESSNFDVENYIGLSRVLGFTMLVSAINVVLLTAIATLMAFLYNMAAALLGGVELTLAEDRR